MNGGDELAQQLTRLTVQVTALRDVVAVLIYRDAKRSPDMNIALQELSEILSARVDAALQLNPEPLPQTVVMAEQVRLQHDWLIQMAQHHLGIGGSPASGQTGPENP
jgi:hypothetical protein